MLTHYDVAVIGSGVGGLVAAANLASRGYRVAVFEKNKHVGGCCSSFSRRGYLFDAAVHWFSGCGPGSFINKLHRRLGVDVPFVRYEPMDRAHYPDLVVEVPDSVDEYAERLGEIFPAERSGIQSLLATFTSLSRLILPSLDSDTQLDFEARHRRVLGLTYEQLLDEHVQDPGLKSLLSIEWGFVGSRPDEVSAAAMGAMLHSYYTGGAYYPLGGAQRFTDSLADAVRSRGGEVFLPSEVLSLYCGGGRVRRLRAIRDVEVTADVYISNIDPQLLHSQIMKFDAPDHEWERFAAGLTHFKRSMSMFVMYLGLDIPSEEFCQAPGWFSDHSLSDISAGKQPWFSTGHLVNVPSLLDPSICPQGKSILIIYTDIDPKDVGEVHDRDWRALRPKYEQRCLDFATRRVHPAIRDRIEVKVSATPRSIFRFTGNTWGSAYGWAMTPEQMGSRRMQVDSPLDNLLFAGHWTLPGGSVQLTAVSGWLASIRAIENLRKQGASRV